MAGLLILTSQRMRLTRSSLPIGIGAGAVTAGVLYAVTPFGPNIDPDGPYLSWWGWAALALPLVTGFLAASFSARDTRPGVLGPAQQGCLAAICGTATAALLLAALTSVTIALFSHHVPLESPPPPSGGGCETCDPNSVVIPPGLRHEYWVELSVGQAGQPVVDTALLIAPLLGAGLGALGGGLGALGGGLARKSPGTSGLKPSLPSGSWTTPLNETFVLITIFPIFGSPSGWCCQLHRRDRADPEREGRVAVDDAGAAAPGKWASAGRPVRLSAGAYTRWKCGEVREEGDARVVTADLTSRARAGDGEAFWELTEPRSLPGR